jgi:hypothetical protein
VLRGLVLVGLLELLRGRSVFAGGRPTGYAWLVLATAIVAAIVSVAIGLRRPRRNTIIVLVNVVLAVAALPMTWHALNAARDAAYNSNPADIAPWTISQMAPGLVYEDIPVENVYAFDRDGRLLQDIRLFDQFGRPLVVGGPGQDPNRRAVRTRAGRTVFNAFPIRYFEPGTERVADPGAGVPARPGRLATKPLGSRR